MCESAGERDGDSGNRDENEAGGRKREETTQRFKKSMTRKM
jgi:hypothetical protein